MRLCKRLDSLTDHLRQFQPHQVAQVTATVHLAVMAAAVVLL